MNHPSSCLFDKSTVSDNRALSLASEHAKRENLPLLVIFVFSPQDYIAHDRGARRIDFTLRNLDVLKDKLDSLNIPLYAMSHSPRKTLPQKVIEIAQNLGTKSLFANLGKKFDTSCISSKI